jgi:hypothetical protein
LVGGRAGDLLAEHLFASSRLELGKLAGKVLGNGRDAGIAVNHARIVHQKFASKKRNRIRALVLSNTQKLGGVEAADYPPL